MRTKVENVMTREVTSVNGATPFKDVAETLMAHAVSALPVVDGENHVVGVVSEADLLHKEEFRDLYYREDYQPPLRTRLRHRLNQEGGKPRAKATGTTAAELMTAPAITVTPDSTAVHAARLMEEHGVKRLPVIDKDGTLLGIVSRHDLLKVFIRTDADLAREIRDEVLRRSLWMETGRVLVQVQRGVVTLTGTTHRRSEAEIAVRMTRRVNGVVDVIDKIEWKEDDGASWSNR